MTRKPFPHSDDLFGLNLRDPKVTQYDWITSVRVTIDGVTINDVTDVLRVPVEGYWDYDVFGRYFVDQSRHDDIRHPSVRRFDNEVWEIILGDHSPIDEVKLAPFGATASSIANDLQAHYPDSVTMASKVMDVEVSDIMRSLTRTLNIHGGAKLC